MRKEQIVHLPKPPLRAGRFRRFCGLLRVRMFVQQREMPKDVSNAIPRLLHLCMDDGIDLTGIRTFKIAIGNHRHGRIVRSSDVILAISDEGYWRRHWHGRSLRKAG